MSVLSERAASFDVRAGRSSMQYLALVAALVDLVVITVACLLAVIVRAHLGWLLTPTDVHASVRRVAPFIGVGWLVVLWLSGSYDTDDFGAGSEEFRRVFNASLISAGLLGVGSYLLKQDLSRGFFVLLFAVGIPGLLVCRLILRRQLQRARARGRFRSRVLLVGSVAHVDEIAAVLRRESWLGYQVTGALTADFGRRLEDPARTPLGVPIVGAAVPADVLRAAADIDAVIFTGGPSLTTAERQGILRELDGGVQVMMAPALAELSQDRLRARAIGGLPLMHVDPPTTERALRFGKRAFDLAGSLVLILVTGPLMLGAAIAVKLHDGGPIFFRQQRVGHDQRVFRCLKFRTMVVDAEARLADLLSGDEPQGLFKMTDDPRITGPGRLLRRFSIDELPQLFNVLRGQMSLVGPRPALPHEVERYSDAIHRRLRVKPGMTGLWQVSGRSDLSYEDAVRLDLYYVDNWSMLQDVNILTKTVGAVISGRGAY